MRIHDPFNSGGRRWDGWIGIQYDQRRDMPRRPQDLAPERENYDYTGLFVRRDRADRNDDFCPEDHPPEDDPHPVDFRFPSRRGTLREVDEAGLRGSLLGGVADGFTMDALMEGRVTFE